jgi:hypothetical protein
VTAAERPSSLLRGLLLDNVGLKALSLAMAMVLFWVVRGSEGAQRAVFVDVVAVLPPPSAEKMLTTELPAKVRLTLRGSRSLLNNVRSDDIPPVQIDLSEPGASVYYFEPERFELPSGIEVAEIAPDAVTLSWADRAVRTLPVRARVSGSPDTGLMLVGEPAVRPATLTVRGAAPDVAVLDLLRTSPIDVAGLGPGRHERRVEIEVPAGHLEVAEDRVVSVSVEIAPEIAERSIPRQELAVTGGSLRELRPNRVRVTLRGAPAVLDAIDAPSIVPYVDASALDPSAGAQPALVRVRGIPEGVELAGVEPEEVLATPVGR